MSAQVTHNSLYTCMTLHIVYQYSDTLTNLSKGQVGSFHLRSNGHQAHTVLSNITVYRMLYKNIQNLSDITCEKKLS